MCQASPGNDTHLLHQKALLQLLQEFDRVCRTLSIPYVLFAGTMLGAVRHKGFIPWDDDLDVLMLREDYERFLKEAESCLNNEVFFLQKEFSDHWPMFFSKLRLNGTTCLEKFHPKDPKIHQGVYIDIFPCDAACRSSFGRHMQFLSSKIVIAKSLYKRGYDTDSISKKAFMQLCRLLPLRPFLWFARNGDSNSELVHTFFGAASNFEKNIYPRRYFVSPILISFEGGEYPISKDYDALLQVIYGDYMRLPPPEQRLSKQHAILVDLNRPWTEYNHFRDHMEFEVYTRSIR